MRLSDFVDKSFIDECLAPATNVAAAPESQKKPI